MDNHGIAGPPRFHRRPNPDGHSETCWSRAQAHTRRDHGSGEFSVTNQQALAALRAGEIECECGVVSGRTKG